MLKADCFCCFTAYCWVFLTSQSLKDWCPALLKPFFTPSNRLFFPSLDHVFVLMGIAFYLVWQEGFTSDRAVLYLHFIRLLVNVFWLLLFFGLRRPRFSFSGYPDYLSINFGLCAFLLPRFAPCWVFACTLSGLNFAGRFSQFLLCA